MSTPTKDDIGGGPDWPAADLRRRLLQSLRIAHRAVDHLGAAGYTDPETGDGLSPHKVVSETSMLLLASAPVATNQDDAMSAAHHRLARALIPHARTGRVGAAICMRPAAAAELSFAHSCLTVLGYPEPAFDDLVEAARRSEVWASGERSPHRAMEQEWIDRVIGRSRAATASLVRFSMLGLRLDALNCTREDVYAFTHALMYATDFGARRPTLPRPWAAIQADAEAALAFSLDAEDYDLAGEVLLTWPLLHRPWSPVASFGFEVVARVEDEAGFLPPPGISADRYVDLSPSERSTAVLAETYHTAYVMGLLSAAGLRPGCSPPSAVEGTGRWAASAPMLELMDRSNEETSEPHWRGSAASLTEGQRDELSPLFLAICLRRAASVLNLELVRTTLRVASRHDLLDAPAPRQALQLLDRAVRFGVGGEHMHVASDATNIA